MSFLLRTLMKASLGTSTLPISLIFFFPSACFFRSFIFRVISPPYCQHRHHLYTVVCMCTCKILFSNLKKIVLTHFARTFFLYALILKEENTELLHLYTFRHKYNSCKHWWMHAFLQYTCCFAWQIKALLHSLKHLMLKIITFLLQLSCFQWLLVQRSQTFVLEWYLWAAHTWISLCCMLGPCKDKKNISSEQSCKALYLLRNV